MKRLFGFLLTGFFFFSALAHQPASSGEILLGLKKLKHMGSVLYIAAHPDDENTRLIAYLSNGALIRTGYLSLTRGDGGQNLIGTEKGEYIGLLRTQELLEARKVDGGTQFFTRAVDFGYSKSSEETLEKWDREKVLKDMVWVIRKFQPEVLITRFPPNNYGGHGHHSASAILAEEAFDKAADPSYAPEQLSYYKPWQPKSLYFNTSTWWDKTIPEQAEGNKEFIQLDIGTYNQERGQWHNEIASLSRSKHKSQGFGTTLSRGSQKEYLKYVKGEKRVGALFSRQDLSWEGVEGGKEVQEMISSLIADFNPMEPSASIKGLVDLRKKVRGLAFDQKEIKLKEIDELILDCYGLYIEAISAQEYVSNDRPETTVEMRIINPSPVELTLLGYKTNYQKTMEGVDSLILNNQEINKEFTFSSPKSEISQPYWLWKDFINMFHVENRENIGKPENDPFASVDLNIRVFGEVLSVTQPIEFKKRDRVKGELRVPLKNYPSVMVTPQVQNLIFSGQTYKPVSVVVKSLITDKEVEVKVNLPKGFEAKEPSFNLQFEEPGEEKTLVFQIKPTVASASGTFQFSASVNEEQFTRGLKTIEYDHITKQVLFPNAEVKATKIDLAHNLKKVGYLMGAGDEVPELLRNIGIDVTLLTPEELNTLNLNEFDVIVGGVRLYNTQKAMAYTHKALMDYVNQGGTYVMQYSTSYGLVTEEIGPFPFQISRKRVTKEEAEVTFLAPDHSIMTSPNTISKDDFKGWNQERGLYFANEWDDRYTPLFAWNDPGEEPQKGGLLVADYGKGAFVYTGISFFRHLPYGVPGSYRLLVNVLSYKPDTP